MENTKLNNFNITEKVILRPLYRVMEWLTFAVFVFTAVMLVIRWPQLPQTMGVHFNAAGDVDIFASRRAVLVPAALQLIMWLMISLAIRFPSEWAVPVRVKKENLAFVRATFRLFALTVRLVLTGLLMWIELSLIYFRPIGPGFTLVSFALLGVILVLTAIYLHRGLK